MFVEVNNTRFRGTFDEMLEAVKKSVYPWYSEMGYTDVNNAEFTTPQLFNNIYRIYSKTRDGIVAYFDIVQDIVPIAPSVEIFSLATASADDQEDGDISHMIVTTIFYDGVEVPEISLLISGVYTVIYSITDSDGDSDDLTLIVTVI